MKFIELVQQRQSVRAYSEKAVERDMLLRCIEAARLSPSACNAQPWKFVVIDEDPLRQEIARETYNNIAPFNKFAMQAPVIVVIVMERPNTLSQIGGRIKNKDFYLFDIGIAAEHFCLQAAEEGLGTCMIGWFNEKNIKELLQVPPKRHIGLIITVGYPKNEDIRKKKRKDAGDIASFNQYL
jgi:nitroreductase